MLHKEGGFQTEMMQNGEVNPDSAYPILLNLLPVGLKGLAFSALTAAVVASLAGKANSISTIFTLDIYKKKFNPNADEKKLVSMGRIGSHRCHVAGSCYSTDCWVLIKKADLNSYRNTLALYRLASSPCLYSDSSGRKRLPTQHFLQQLAVLYFQ